MNAIYSYLLNHSQWSVTILNAIIRKYYCLFISATRKATTTTWICACMYVYIYIYVCMYVYLLKNTYLFMFVHCKHHLTTSPLCGDFLVLLVPPFSVGPMVWDSDNWAASLSNWASKRGGMAGDSNSLQKGQAESSRIIRSLPWTWFPMQIYDGMHTETSTSEVHTMHYISIHRLCSEVSSKKDPVLSSCMYCANANKMYAVCMHESNVWINECNYAYL